MSTRTRQPEQQHAIEDHEMTEQTYRPTVADVATSDTGHTNTLASLQTGHAPLAIPETGHTKLATPSNGQEAVEIGRALNVAKAQHRGDFAAFVEARCDFSYRSARRYMQAAADADREAAITDFTQRMRAAVQSVSVECGFQPTRFSTARLTDAELDQLLTAGLQLALPGTVADVLRHSGLAAKLIGYASEHVPHATLGDIAEAVSRVHLLLLSAIEARNALAVLDHMPPDGIVASWAAATDGEPDDEGGV